MTYGEDTMNRGNRRGQPAASDLVRVMTDGHAEGYHGRPAPLGYTPQGYRRHGFKRPGSHITQREIRNRTHRPVDGRQVAHIEDGMIMYTPTEEEYRQREIDYLNSLPADLPSKRYHERARMPTDPAVGVQPRPVRLKLPPQYE